MNIRLSAGTLFLAVCASAATADRRIVDAAKAQDVQAVRALLQQRADVNATQGDGATALHWAAHWDDRTTAEILLRAGANANAADDEGVTPLSLACLNASPLMVELLLKAGANPNLAQLNGETPLMTAAHTGNLEVLKLLLARGADVNAREAAHGQTALMRAVAENHPDAVQLLVESKADVHARSKTGFTPLLFAAQQGNLRSAEILLQAGADVNESAPDGIAGDTNARSLFKPNTQANALLVAIDSGHEAMAKFLVERGADVNQNGAGRTPLHSAVQQNMPDLVKILLDHHANPNVKTTRPMPLLSRYIQAQTGVDVNPIGATPFWLAADFGDIRSMRILIAGGADPSLATADKTTPLMAAAGADFIEGQDRYGRRWFQDTTMPLQRAALEAVKYCLELGADVNAANANGLTAMHGAAYMGSNLIAQFLFDHGAKLDVRNRLGQTPYFITQGVYQAGSFIVRKETGELLRTLGADTSITADKGQEVNAPQGAR